MTESDDFTEDEIEQIKESRKNISEGKSRLFKNADEYIKSLDEE